MPDSSSEAQKQKHDAMHVFTYGLSPQHIETCHLAVSFREERKGPRDGNVNRMLLWERLWLWCIWEHVKRCISAWWNEWADTGREESDSWELHMWCFWVHISVPMSTAATSAPAISILMWRIIITAFPTGSVLRQRGLATSKVYNIHKRIENRFVPITGQGAKVRVPQRKADTWPSSQLWPEEDVYVW